MLARILAALVALFRRPAAAPPPDSPAAAIPIPPVPAADRLPGIDLAYLTQPHGAFDSTARWHLTPRGLAVNGVVTGTPGEPETARKAFAFFGIEFRAAAKQYGVPIELLVACACAESGVHIRQGREQARMSERREPGFTSYGASPHRVSVGVMHTLISTARQALADPLLGAIDLQQPGVSIRAGAAYIGAQKRHTRFDPPLVAAAYNAGGVYDDPTPGLPFSLRDFPFGQDRHIERFVAYFNDVCGLVEADPALAGSAPSFVRALAR